MKDIILAIPKGRIYKEILYYLNFYGIIIKKFNNTRKLILLTNISNLKIILCRSSDIALYVNKGLADLGVVGKDILIENNYKNIKEILNLKIAKCRLSIAIKKNNIYNNILKKKKIYVSTKYINITKNYFNNKINIKLIKLHGSIELSPILGLSDIILDLVDTGKTLKENNLLEIKKIINISSRLIVNRFSYFKKYIKSIILYFKKK